MLKKIAGHFRHFRGPIFALAATVLTVAGLASYQPDEPFYKGDGAWLMASVLQTPKPNPYTRGEFVVDVVKHLKRAKCHKSLCADMKGGTPEEKARCELEKRGVFDKPTSYKWHEEVFNRAEAIKIIVATLDLPLAENAKQPFTDVKGDTWYAPYVAAAVKAKLIKDNRTHRLLPNETAKLTWTRLILRKTNLKQLCAQ